MFEKEGLKNTEKNTSLLMETEELSLDSQIMEELKRGIRKEVLREVKNPQKIEELRKEIEVFGREEEQPELQKKETLEERDNFIKKHGGESYIFNKIIKYIEANSQKDIDQLNKDLATDKDAFLELQGINEALEFTLDNGDKGYVVIIDKKDWFDVGRFGIALPSRGVAIVQGSSFESVKKARVDHEVYHLNNHKPEQIEKMSRAERIFREVDTIWTTNVKKNFMGSLIGSFESFTNIINSLRNFRKYKKLLGGIENHA